MAYELEAIAQDFAPQDTKPVWRPDRVIDHAEHARPVKAAVPAPTSSAAPVTPPPAAVETPSVTLAPAAAALARREQRYQQQQVELKKQLSALEIERKELTELRELKAKLEAKDYATIEKYAPYEEYTNHLIEKLNGVSPEQEEMRQLKTEISQLRETQKSDMDSRFEAAVALRREAVLALVNSNPELSSVKELDASEHVVQHILTTFEEDGIELTPEQAAKEVEQAIVEEAQKWASLSKVKPKETPKEPAKTETKTSEEKKEDKPVVKTITNTMAATGDIKRKLNYSAMRSDEERWAAARAAVAATATVLKG